MYKRQLGIAEGALDRAIAYTKERKQFGRTIAQQQNTQFKLADMAARIEAAQLLVYKAAMAKATQKVYSVEEMCIRDRARVHFCIQHIQPFHHRDRQRTDPSNGRYAFLQPGRPYEVNRGYRRCEYTGRDR